MAINFKKIVAWSLVYDRRGAKIPTSVAVIIKNSNNNDLAENVYRNYMKVENVPTKQFRNSLIQSFAAHTFSKLYFFCVQGGHLLPHFFAQFSDTISVKDVFFQLAAQNFAGSYAVCIIIILLN